MSSLMLTVGGHPGAHGPSQEGEGRGLKELQGMQVKVGITCEKFWVNSSTWGQGQDEMKSPGVWGLTLTLTWYQNVHGVWQVGTVLSNPPKWIYNQTVTFFPYVNLIPEGNSLAVQGLGLGAFTAVARVQSLVREIRSRKPCGMAKIIIIIIP